MQKKHTNFLITLTFLIPSVFLIWFVLLRPQIKSAESKCYSPNGKQNIEIQHGLLSLECRVLDDPSGNEQLTKTYNYFW